MNRNNRAALSKGVRATLSLILVGLYIAGLIAMIAGGFQLGLYLWVFSTVGGIGLLYYIRTMNKRAEEAAKIARGMPYGEPDDPAAPVQPAVPEDEARAPGDAKP